MDVMEWLTGLALLPALACAVMMGGMALGAVFGLRRTHDNTSAPPAPQPERRTGELDEVAR
jgi:hypothetical protein